MDLQSFHWDRNCQPILQFSVQGVRKATFTILQLISHKGQYHCKHSSKMPIMNFSPGFKFSFNEDGKWRQNRNAFIKLSWNRHEICFLFLVPICLRTIV